MASSYDALLLVSFGGPEKRKDVIPFLENVLRGRKVPRKRMMEVAEHYDRFGGKSPLNEQNRALVAAIEQEFSRRGPHLPVYWGNRNWHPLLADTLRRMAGDGVRRALAFVTSAYSSYSGCRQYLDDIALAREQVGPGAHQVDKLRVFFNHPGFIEPMAEHVAAAIGQLPQHDRDTAELVYTAHSIPVSMARSSRYVEELTETARLVSRQVNRDRWTLVYQSRSGPPSQAWLEPDICDFLRELAASRKTRSVVVLPLGFISDHLEVVYDLDTAALAVAKELGLNMVRAATVGVHPEFVSMVRELVLERLDENAPRRFLEKQTKGPWPPARLLPAGLLPPPAASRRFTDGPKSVAGSSISNRQVGLNGRRKPQGCSSRAAARFRETQVRRYSSPTLALL